MTTGLVKLSFIAEKTLSCLETDGHYCFKCGKDKAQKEHNLKSSEKELEEF